MHKIHRIYFPAQAASGTFEKRKTTKITRGQRKEVYEILDIKLLGHKKYERFAMVAVVPEVVNPLGA